jgi:hypothetical protein
MKKEDEELMKLKHDPEPGYRTYFYIAITVAVLYLAVIFIRG